MKGGEGGQKLQGKHYAGQEEWPAKDIISLNHHFAKRRAIAPAARCKQQASSYPSLPPMVWLGDSRNLEKDGGEGVRSEGKGSAPRGTQVRDTDVMGCEMTVTWAEEGRSSGSSVYGGG